MGRGRGGCAVGVVSEPMPDDLYWMALCMALHGAKGRNSWDDARAVLDSLRDAGYVVVRAEPPAVNGHPVHYCAGCMEEPGYNNADEFWCPSCGQVTTGRFV